ncbi:MAG: hypothetical protein OIF38_04340 [Cellvibrionaceae bacterium]|nr:hypothetical protein [Cellvibrionaceae bacterium]
MQTAGTIQKWGNGVGIRLNRQILAAAGIDLDQEVEITTSKGRLIIEVPDSVLERELDRVLAQEEGAEELIDEALANIAKLKARVSRLEAKADEGLK